VDVATDCRIPCLDGWALLISYLARLHRCQGMHFCYLLFSSLDSLCDLAVAWLRGDHVNLGGESHGLIHLPCFKIDGSIA
jgi:hypothetical protein